MAVLLSKAFWVLSSLSSAFPIAKQAIPTSFRHAVGEFLLNKVIVEYPDRVFMRETIIPFLLQRHVRKVLSVGVRQYTVEITDRLIEAGIEVWTMDIDPDTHVWGAPGRHIVGDAMRLPVYEAARDMPCILFNGVLGFGIDSPDEVGRALRALSEVLSADGLLVLGWNSDRLPDPVHHPEFSRFQHLQTGEIPSRVTFPNSTHVYDFLEHARS
jgi:uncharacterized UPF0146 family protein